MQSMAISEWSLVSNTTCEQHFWTCYCGNNLHRFDIRIKKRLCEDTAVLHFALGYLHWTPNQYQTLLTTRVFYKCTCVDHSGNRVTCSTLGRSASRLTVKVCWDTHQVFSCSVQHSWASEDYVNVFEFSCTKWGKMTAKSVRKVDSKTVECKLQTVRLWEDKSKGL